MFDHTGVVAGSCATCHNGTNATGKPTTGHIPTTQACDACHTNTTNWLPVPATYGHAGVAAQPAPASGGNEAQSLQQAHDSAITQLLLVETRLAHSLLG